MNDQEERRVGAAARTNNDKLLMLDQHQALSRARRIAKLIGLTLPIIITIVGTALLIFWLPRMPDPAAVHWGIAGEPNGYGSPWINILTIGLTSLFLIVVFLFESFQARQGLSKPGAAVWGNTNRTIPAAVLGLVCLLQASMLMLTIPQLDADSAQTIEPVPWALPTSFSIGIVVALIAFFLQPRVRIARPAEQDAEPMPLEETERAFWLGETRASALFLWVVGVGLVAIAGGVVLMYTAGTEFWWIMLLILLLLAVASAASLWFSIYVNDAGLSVRSMLGWPKFYVPASDIDHVAVAHIAPISEFGGWGIRWGSGKLGIVMRTGEGIIVTRRDGRIFAITVDDAETGAAVLAAAARAATKLPEGREKQ